MGKRAIDQYKEKDRQIDRLTGRQRKGKTCTNHEGVERYLH